MNTLPVDLKMTLLLAGVWGFAVGVVSMVAPNIVLGLTGKGLVILWRNHAK